MGRDMAVFFGQEWNRPADGESDGQDTAAEHEYSEGSAKSTEEGRPVPLSWNVLPHPDDACPVFRTQGIAMIAAVEALLCCSIIKLCLCLLNGSRES